MAQASDFARREARLEAAKAKLAYLEKTRKRRWGNWRDYLSRLGLAVIVAAAIWIFAGPTPLKVAVLFAATLWRVFWECSSRRWNEEVDEEANAIYQASLAGG